MGTRWVYGSERGDEDVRFEGEERELVRDVPLPKQHLVNLSGQPRPVQGITASSQCPGSPASIHVSTSHRYTEKRKGDE